MIIAIDTRGSIEYRHFINETFNRIISQQPGHTFIFISDQPFDSSFVTGENVSRVLIKKKSISFLEQLSISSLLKKQKADVLVTGRSLKTKTPQCLIPNDHSGPASLKRAQRIIVHSNFSKAGIAKKYKIDENKIDVVYKGVGNNSDGIEPGEREKIKEQYTGGNEYFLTLPGSLNSLVNLLKAFSIFKKMQKSNMQLLIVPQSEILKEFTETLRLYKFKSEVRLLDDRSKKKLVQLMSSAYAVISPFERSDYTGVLEAINCHVPVIANQDEELQEVCGAVILYVNAADHNDIADKLMLVYKDENLRRRLVEKGMELVNQFNWDNSAGSLWKSIEKACG